MLIILDSMVNMSLEWVPIQPFNGYENPHYDNDNSQIFKWAPKIMKEMATGTIWIVC